MSTGTLQRLEQRLFAAWHIVEHAHLRKIIMEAFERLSNDVQQAIAASSSKDAEIADLKKQLADAKAQPAGTSDDKLNGLSDQLEAMLNASTGTGSGGANTPIPVVGATSTTVSDPATGNTTTVDHATGEASTTDASGTQVATDTSAAGVAVQAALDAGAMQGTPSA